MVVGQVASMSAGMSPKIFELDSIIISQFSYFENI